ncbi:hypothetical protein PAXRUDRAFT_830806 [Paxillus rubicundulus Ve08.2h10]|uniref:Uncharacterized protein n=1 Tax=Paxillus rubicundulus Ve08.2h10 TaxID=930991 RepID=A0A0D0D4M4_9AGAM|nr:hypothetical protein PAXRUDRAFT_830806 [Paxillus rubicundulus Ve08.2h10]
MVSIKNLQYVPHTPHAQHVQHAQVKHGKHMQARQSSPPSPPWICFALLCSWGCCVLFPEAGFTTLIWMAA